MHITASPKLLSILVALLPLAYLVGSAIADAVMIIVSILFFIQCANKRDLQWIRQPWIQAAMLLIIYLLIQSLFTENPKEALARSVGFTRFPLAALVIATVLAQNAAMRGKFSLSLVAVVGFFAFDGLLQYFTGTDILGKPLHGEAYPRLTGPYSDPKIGIMLAWFGMPVILLLAVKKPFGLHPVLRAAFILAIIATIVLSGERMALLLLLLGLVLSVLLYIKKWLLTAAVAAALLTLCSLTIYFSPEEGLLKQRVVSFTSYLSDIWETPYGQIWISTGKIVSDNPLFGVGLKHFRTECINTEYDTHHPINVRCNLHPHQLYLEWLVETGIIGTGLFLLMIFFIMRDVVAAYPHHAKNPFYIGLLVALCLRLWPISTSTSFFVAWSALPFWILLGVALSYSYEKKNNDTPTLPVQDA